MHPEFKILEIFSERFANPINKRVHCKSQYFLLKFSIDISFMLFSGIQSFLGENETDNFSVSNN